LVSLLISAGSLGVAAAAGCDVLPTPQSVVPQKGFCRVGDFVALSFKITPDVQIPSKELAEAIVGKGVNIRQVSTVDTVLAPESYALTVSGTGAEITASSYSGLIYGLQTLAQLVSDKNEVECVTISDTPRCGWRGFMLDSGRQWQSVETIKKYIDMASMLKLNRFHWHLTEGLGWRPEIKAYPNLTEIGANVGHAPGQKGCYSREQMAEIVEYAAQRAVQIVPEIDIPGHSEAALVAYPWASCTGSDIKVPEVGFSDNIFCAGKDTTIAMLETILDEICDIFPSEYIHIGGDEAPKGNWDKCPHCIGRINNLGLKDSHDLQLWLAARMATHLKTRNRKAVMWGDVVYSIGYPLPDNCVVQWWNFRSKGDLAVRNALKSGLEVILSPNYYNYLNFPVTPWAGYSAERTFDLEDAYCRNPMTAVLDEDNPLVLGATCALWTDYGVTESMIDSRVFPRIFALTQRMWHRGEELTYEALCARIAKVRPFFEKRGFCFGPADRAEAANYYWSICQPVP